MTTRRVVSHANPSPDQTKAPAPSPAPSAVQPKVREPSASEVLLWSRMKTWATILAIFVFVWESFVPTMYGKFGGANSPVLSVSPRVGWALLELPCWSVFAVLFWVKGGPQSHLMVPRLLACVFFMHYMYRGMIYPYMVTPSKRKDGKEDGFDIVVALAGAGFVSVTHAFLNARWLSTHGKILRSKAYLKSPQFIIGALMYYSGLFLIVWHDHIQRQLRAAPDAPRYSIPRGALWDYATSANYTAELWAWMGWWIMSGGGMNGAFIFFVSLANLGPRAVSNHAWYLKTFGDEYAQLNRAKLIPGVW